MSEIKGQGHSKVKCTFAAETYISTVWRWGLLVIKMMMTMINDDDFVYPTNCVRYFITRVYV